MKYVLLLCLLFAFPPQTASMETQVATTCDKLVLEAAVVPTFAKRFRVTLANHGSSEIVAEKDRLAATYRIEEFNEGKWELLISSGIGRGVSSSGTTPPACLDSANRVGLRPDEQFSLVTDLEGALADLQKETRHRLVLVYHLPECRLQSNAVELAR